MATNVHASVDTERLEAAAAAAKAPTLAGRADAVAHGGWEMVGDTGLEPVTSRV